MASPPACADKDCHAETLMKAIADAVEGFLTSESARESYVDTDSSITGIEAFLAANFPKVSSLQNEQQDQNGYKDQNARKATADVKGHKKPRGSKVNTKNLIEAESKSFPFLSLPFELRLIIYRLLYVKPNKGKHSCYQFMAWSFKSNAAEQLLLCEGESAAFFVNRQIRAEVSAIFYHENVFNVGRHPTSAEEDVILEGKNMTSADRYQENRCTSQVEECMVAMYGRPRLTNLMKVNFALVQRCHVSCDGREDSIALAAQSLERFLRGPVPNLKYLLIDLRTSRFYCGPVKIRTLLGRLRFVQNLRHVHVHIVTEGAPAQETFLRYLERNMTSKNLFSPSKPLANHDLRRLTDPLSDTATHEEEGNRMCRRLNIDPIYPGESASFV